MKHEYSTCDVCGERISKDAEQQHEYDNEEIENGVVFRVSVKFRRWVGEVAKSLTWADLCWACAGTIAESSMEAAKTKVRELAEKAEASR